MVALAFNANEVAPSVETAGSLPLGCHLFEITSAEVSETKAGGNGMLVLNVLIIEGPNAGVTGAYRLNMWHSNPQTVEIAKRQLSSICHVTGRLQLNDTSDLHGARFIGKVVKQKVAPGQEDKGYTEIKGVYDTAGVGPMGQGRLTVEELENKHVDNAHTSQPAVSQAPAGNWGQPQQQQTAPAASGWGQQPAAAQQQAPAAQPQAQQPSTAWPQQQPSVSAPANVAPPAQQQPQQQQQAPAFNQGAGQTKAPWEQ